MYGSRICPREGGGKVKFSCELTGDLSNFLSILTYIFTVLAILPPGTMVKHCFRNA